MGTSRVRGIDTSHWKACMATPGMNFTADYYFTGVLIEIMPISGFKHYRVIGLNVAKR